jgi:predicted phosphodiesterase
MRLHVLSDLHLEFADFVPPNVDCDLVVLAGDIHNGTKGLEWARATWPDKPVLYVPGNHEYYEFDLAELPARLRAVAADLDIIFLDRDEIHLHGRRILGCTLWTDFDAFGMPLRAEAMAASERYLTDYRLITDRGTPLRAERTRELHLRDRAWLEARMAESKPDEKLVVITHMVPSMRSTADRFRDKLTTAGFSSHLDHLVERTDLWIHGHTHDSYDYRIGRGRVVCNPRGYPFKGVRKRRASENPDFRDGLVVTV